MYVRTYTNVAGARFKAAPPTLLALCCEPRGAAEICRASSLDRLPEAGAVGAKGIIESELYLFGRFHWDVVVDFVRKK